MLFCIVAAILCFFILKETLSLPAAIAIGIMAIGLIMLGIIEKKANESENVEDRKYRKSI